MHTLASSISDLEGQIEETEQSIEAKEAEVETKKQEIVDGIGDLKLRLRAMYIAGNDSYTDILIGATDFYDMLMKLELVKRVANYDNEMIDGLVEKKEQYEAEAEELSEQKAQLEADLDMLASRREKQQSQMTKLEELYSQSEESLQQLETDQETYESNLEKIQKEQDEFEESLQELYKEQEAIKEKEEAERKAKEEAEKKAKEEAAKKAKEEAEKKAKEEAEKKAQEEAAKKEQESQNSSSSDSSGSDTSDDTTGSTTTETTGGNTNADYGYVDKSQFTWPVPGYYHISYGVGWRWGAYHKGIDIYSANIRGANICAAASGTVILVSNTCTHDYGKSYSCGCGGGYGNYCIIDHGNGYWTLYGHSERMNVTKGQYVNQGDVLGTVGSTGYSTGPHLHFEVRINGTAVNPSNYV
jgi:murein DD-endopeptidase MepM/ murein hydrolase activator NlpD